MRKGSNVILLHVDIQLSQYHLLKKIILSPRNVLRNLVENQLVINAMAYFWIVSSVPLPIHMHCVDY